MSTKPKGRSAPGHFSFSCSLEVLALIAAAAFINFAIPQEAQSQISSHTISVPFSSSGAHHVEVRQPKAPVQVEMPVPPPMKIFPGLAEPLVATGPVTDEEGKDLDAALAAFHDAPAKAGKDGDFTDTSKPLLAFIAAHPNSNWNAALHTNLGFGYFHDGYYSHAFTEFGQAWQLGRDATSPQAHMMIDRAVGELALMHSRVGHKDELDQVLKEIGSRPIGGPATETLHIAHHAQSSFHNATENSYLCGPKALRNVLKTMKASKKQIDIADKAKSGPHGYSLQQLAALATKTGLKYKLIHREPGQPVPVPSIVNWNIHHFAAVVDERDGHYFIADPTFGYGGGGILKAKAIDAESSGYFLVPAKVMAANPKAGWRIVSAKSDEAKAVYGMGVTDGNSPGQVQNPDPCNCIGNAPPDSDPNGFIWTTTTGWIPPMTIAMGTPTTVSLRLQDQPVGYKPQVGKLPNFERISYNQREDLQPANFPFSNLSSKWSHNWMAYITYNPTVYGYGLSRNAGGGGGFYATQIWQTSTGQYPGDTIDLSDIVSLPVGSAPTSFVRYLPDGSLETYDKPNGATTFPAYMFLTKVTDPQGNTTTLTWTNYSGTQWRLTSITDAMGRSTTYTYGLSGYPLLITKITDPFGRTAQLTYDTSARLSTITDPVGITSTFGYSTSEPTFVNSLTTPYGTSTFSDAVNPNDHPYSGTVSSSLTLTDPLGYMEYFYYYQANPSYQVTPDTDPSNTIPAGQGYISNSNLSWRNTYHWSKHQWAACLADMTNPCSISSGVVQNENFNYPSLTHWYHWAQFTDTHEKSRQISSIKQPLENRVWFSQAATYNGLWSGYLDRPIQVGRVLDGDTTTQLTTTTYNFFPGGSYTAYPWPLNYTDALGRVTTFTYAANNIDPLTVQQWIGGTSYSTIATYGSYVNHRPQTYTGADGQAWNYTYNTAGQLKTVTDPNSGVTTYHYDSTGRLSTIVNANNQTILTNTYDSADRVQTQTDSQGYMLTYAYDNIDRITSITYPDGTTDQYDHTFQSGPNVGTQSLELRKYTDRLGRVTTYAYDADRRLTSVTEPVTSTTTRTTSYTYYEDGTLKDIIDANGNDTRWTIDIESRPTSKTYAYGTSAAQTETYTWESNGGARLKSITDALGQVKTFTYAKDDRITGIAYTNTVNTTPNVTFTYDTYFPRLTSMTDGLGTTNYSYTAISTNGALKLSSLDGPYSNDAIGLTYDALGRPSGRNITGGNETFGYDAISRLTSHGTPLGSFTIGYLGQTDQITSQSVTNGSTTVSTNWGYDTNTNDRRLISITNSGVTRSYTFGYGSSPVNVYDTQSITDTVAAGHPWATQSHSYTNDMIDRLLTASATTPGNFSYGYDNLDNPTTVTNPSGTTNPTFNGLNQISTWGPNTYSYDSNGNTLSGDGTRTYKWDAENRLIEVDYVGTSNKSVFSYDGMGHRTVDAETVSGTTTATYYLWCGSLICQTRNSSQSAIRRDLLEGEYNVSTGQMLVYMPDQLGSVRDVIDASMGNLVQSYDYSPYGTVTRSNGSTPTDFQFAWLFHHAASGLNFATYRVQDGNTGRWLNRDPIREAGGLNLYSYVGAETITWSDWLGLGEFDEEPPLVGPGSHPPLGHIPEPYEHGPYFLPHIEVPLGPSGVGPLLGKVCPPKPAEVTTGAGAGAKGPSIPVSVGKGPYAGPSVPAGPSSRPTAEQQSQINQIGVCHTCGTTDPGTKSGNFIGDHQDPTALNQPGKPQVYLPQCLTCSQSQGGRVRQILRNGG